MEGRDVPRVKWNPEDLSAELSHDGTTLPPMGLEELEALRDAISVVLGGGGSTAEERARGLDEYYDERARLSSVDCGLLQIKEEEQRSYRESMIASSKRLGLRHPETGEPQSPDDGDRLDAEAKASGHRE